MINKKNIIEAGTWVYVYLKHKESIEKFVLIRDTGKTVLIVGGKNCKTYTKLPRKNVYLTFIDACRAAVSECELREKK